MSDRFYLLYFELDCADICMGYNGPGANLRTRVTLAGFYVADARRCIIAQLGIRMGAGKFRALPPSANMR